MGGEDNGAASFVVNAAWGLPACSAAIPITAMSLTAIASCVAAVLITFFFLFPEKKAFLESGGVAGLGNIILSRWC